MEGEKRGGNQLTVCCRCQVTELPRLPLPDGTTGGRVRTPGPPPRKPAPRATRKLAGMLLVAAAGVAAVSISRRMDSLPIPIPTAEPTPAQCAPFRPALDVYCFLALLIQYQF